jgi:hypothetical protein
LLDAQRFGAGHVRPIVLEGYLMNKALTDGIQLMPPAFALGLDDWSSEDGTPGSSTYDGASNATLIAADADFGGCLEMLKTVSTQKLRYSGNTPMIPGCYWQIRARIKAVSGPLPSVRIAAWAANSSGAHVTGLDETGPSVALQNYGEVVEVSAIVGSGARGGVDMVWGQTPVFAHFGIDLTGVSTGIVRIDDIIIEDVTSIYIQSKLDVVDVTDFGAVGDGTTNNVAAFEAADAAANGRTVLVPEGDFNLNSTVTISSEIRFHGTVTMPSNAQLQLLQNFDYPTYFTAFRNEQTAFEKALQALFNFTDHESLDLMGRSVELTSPVDVHAVVGNKDRHSNRRVIRNGRLSANSNSSWASETVTRTASYDANDPYKLKNVANASGVLAGSLIEGAGVGREVYVRSVNASNGELTLSLPLYAAPSNQTYTFTRHKYLLDFSGFEWLSRFTLENIDFACNGRSSGVMLADDGLIFHVKDCYFSGPKDRGLTSTGEACAGILLDRNQWLSNEQDLSVSQRSSIGFNVNCNDAKIRNTRAIRFNHWCVISGGGAIVSGNHFFQDDSTGGNIRNPGMIIARNHPKITIIGNYIDNCSVEWTNEHDPTPDIVTGYSFGAMTMTGNHFTSSDSVEWFRWISIKPHGTGHFLNGVTITGNVFKAFDGPELQRVENVDDSIAPLLPEKFRNVTIDSNTFNGVRDTFMNPLTIEVEKTSIATGWRTGIGAFMPFEGKARFGTALVPNGPIRNSSNQIVYTQPYFTGETGPTGKSFDIDWSQGVKGKIRATIRCDDTK